MRTILCLSFATTALLLWALGLYFSCHKLPVVAAACYAYHFGPCIFGYVAGEELDKAQP